MSQLSLFQKLVADAKSRIREVDIQHLTNNSHSKPIIIDVREDSDWKQGHVPDAIHLSRGIIELNIEQQIPDLAAPIVCYCGGGSRSALVADNLQKMGYTRVSSLAGGFKAWKDSGNPIARESVD